MARSTNPRASSKGSVNLGSSGKIDPESVPWKDEDMADEAAKSSISSEPDDPGLWGVPSLGLIAVAAAFLVSR
jgi:hypothetical protein